MKKETFETLLHSLIAFAVGAILGVMLILLFVDKYSTGTTSSSVGTFSAVRSAQGMYHAKYKTYGTFGDLYNAKFLQEETFNVGNGSAYKYGYTLTLTVTSSSSWYCVGVSDDSDSHQVMMDETGSISTSEDAGKTWTPLGQ